MSKKEIERQGVQALASEISWTQVEVMQIKEAMARLVCLIHCPSQVVHATCTFPSQSHYRDNCAAAARDVHNSHSQRFIYRHCVNASKRHAIHYVMLAALTRLHSYS